MIKAKKTFLTLLLITFLFSSYGQFVVSDPSLLQAAERQNAMQLREFSEAVQSGRTLAQIQGMQKDMVNIFNKSQGFIQDMGMFIQVGERLVVLEQELKNFGQFESYYKKGGSGASNVLQQITSYYSVIESLINSCTAEGLTPHDRVNILTVVNENLNKALSLIQQVKQIVSGNIRSSATKNIYNNMLYNSGGWKSYRIGFGS